MPLDHDLADGGQGVVCVKGADRCLILFPLLGHDGGRADGRYVTDSINNGQGGNEMGITRLDGSKTFTHSLKGKNVRERKSRIQDITAYISTMSSLVRGDGHSSYGSSSQSLSLKDPPCAALVPEAGSGGFLPLRRPPVDAQSSLGID